MVSRQHSILNCWRTHATNRFRVHLGSGGSCRSWGAVAATSMALRITQSNSDSMIFDKGGDDRLCVETPRNQTLFRCNNAPMTLLFEGFAQWLCPLWLHFYLC